MGEQDCRVASKPGEEAAGPECPASKDVQIPGQTAKTTRLRPTREEGGEEGWEGSGVWGGWGEAAIRQSAGGPVEGAEEVRGRTAVFHMVEDTTGAISKACRRPAEGGEGEGG